MRSILACLFVMSCGQSAKTQQCMTMGGKNELVTDAKLLRLDIYPDSVMCSDGDVPAGSVPLLSHTFKPGEAVTLDIPPGKRTLVLTTFADDAGTLVTGMGCTTTTLSPGGQMCISLTILAAPDLAVIADLSMGESCIGSGCPCTPAGSPTGDSCPGGQFCDSQSLMCAVGCKSNSDCVGLGPAGDGGLPRSNCSTTLHQCVECVSNADCPLGKLCSPSGVCVQGCDTGHACPGGLTCCNSLCVDTTSDTLNCGSCGIPCNVGNATTCCASLCTDLNSSADNCGVCGRICSGSNVAARLCSIGQCTPACVKGRSDCNLPNTNDGCETDITTPTHCGGCNLACADNNSAHATSSSCDSDGGICSYVCASPFADCDATGANINGCETNIQNGDPDHCGGCMNSSCDSLNSVGRNCAGGVCTYGGCMPNQGDCTNSGDPRNLSGCETSTTSVTMCGSCLNAACDTNHNGAKSPLCALDGGAAHCVYNCTGNFIDCNNTPPNTAGCDIDKTTSTANCTGCGIACDTTTGTPTCNGNRCVYGCNSGKADCNTSGVNTPGCECSTSTTPPDGGCCGTGCQTPHSNCMRSGSTACTGLGQSYFDCTGTGTFTVAQAMKACVAKTGNAVNCHLFTCPSTDDGIVCDATTGTCNCWDYSLTGTNVNAGLVYVHQPADSKCFCPVGDWPTWN